MLTCTFFPLLFFSSSEIQTNMDMFDNNYKECYIEFSYFRPQDPCPLRSLAIFIYIHFYQINYIIVITFGLNSHYPLLSIVQLLFWKLFFALNRLNPFGVYIIIVSLSMRWTCPCIINYWFAIPLSKVTPIPICCMTFSLRILSFLGILFIIIKLVM